jgi:IS30 family transposase
MQRSKLLSLEKCNNVDTMKVKTNENAKISTNVERKTSDTHLQKLDVRSSMQRLDMKMIIHIPNY